MTRRILTVALGTLALAACGGSETPEADARTVANPAGGTAQTASDVGTAPAASMAAADLSDDQLPSVVVYKSPTCGCCNGWVEHLREAGFEVEPRDVRDLMSVKLDAGVPPSLSSCHTALIDGYVVEGHVPADVVKKLLAERPPVAGISVAGMPVGSPGMEGPNAQPYTVEAFTADGSHSTFAEVDPR